jgi:hypothetical protein
MFQAYDEGKTMRKLKTHLVEGAAAPLDVTAADGGVYYYIEGGRDEEQCHTVSTTLQFQNGPIGAGQQPKGITNESLLAVVIDRLQQFQAGPFKCRENALALTHLEEALHWLHHRTRDRISRGVEGTDQT